MFEIGMKVKILPYAEYHGRFTGKIGTVKRISESRAGVEFPDEKNTASSYGVFWFKVKNLESVTGLSLGDFFTGIAGMEFFDARHQRTLPFPDIKRVIYSGPKTIILWGDGTKTIVSCGENENYDHYTGFCAAITKKLFGSTSHAKKVLGRVIHVD